jgi:hypothetical protein
MSDDKFGTAERATKQIENHTRRAVEVLSNGFNGQIMINAYSGAFSEPQARASDLRIAVDELRKAPQLLEATEWPTDADYRRL